MSLLAKTTGGIGCALMALPLLAVLILAAGMSNSQLTAGTSGRPSTRALADIPHRYLTLYQRAAPTCRGLSWTILAAVGKVESNHGRHPSMRSSAGAVGPMQFLPATFRRYARPVPPGGKKPATPWDPADAVYAAARYLCANGAKTGHLRRAIWHYNHADWYVRKVLRTAHHYATATTPPAPTGAAGKAISYARAQLGSPYRWGGDGPSEGGFDCSGLTQAAYRAAGIQLPRTAQTQYEATPHLRRGQPLRPGDLLFYGHPGRLHHVGLYLGNGKMIHAPHRHARVRIEDYRQAGSDFAVATRPTARSHR